jgi:hypothetical protein
MNHDKDVFYVGFQEGSRYETPGWILAERQASEDYRTGNIKAAKSIDDMFEQIENADDKREILP